MSRDLICSVLNVPPDPWPPNHYALLGVSPSEFDSAQLEAKATELAARLRTYQLGFPELVTDALNRIAQALVCLQDPRTRAVYDAELAGGRAHAAPPPVVIRRERDHSLPHREPYRVLAFGRRWLDSWIQLGRWLGDTHYQLHDRREAVALIAAARSVHELSRHEHAAIFLDETKPGAAVLQFTRRQRLLRCWRKLSADQRRRLADDLNGAVAAIGREMKRQRQRVARRRGPERSIRRAGRFFAGDGIDITIVVLALAAVAIALIRNRY